MQGHRGQTHFLLSGFPGPAGRGRMLTTSVMARLGGSEPQQTSPGSVRGQHAQAAAPSGQTVGPWPAGRPHVAWCHVCFHPEKPTLGRPSHPGVGNGCRRAARVGALHSAPCCAPVSQTMLPLTDTFPPRTFLSHVGSPLNSFRHGFWSVCVEVAWVSSLLL